MSKAHPLSALFLACACATLVACERTGSKNTSSNGTDGETVGQKVDRAVGQTREGLARAGEQVKPALERAGDSIERGAEKVKPTLERAGESLREAASSDAAITASIKADYLKDPDLSVFRIDVDTQAGVVTLNGEARDAAARERAGKLAAANKGVREVHNRLTVRQG